MKVMKADSKNVARLLRTARGQIDGVLRMIEEDRYCLDITGQISAASSILKKARSEVLRAHLRSCVADTLKSGNPEDIDRKVEELITVMEKNT